MNDLASMNTRMDQWMAEKPSGWNNEGKFALNNGDIAFGYFVAAGNDGDRYISIYRSHVFPMVGKNNNRYNLYRWCPAKSGNSMECPNCATGHTDVKERMSMYFYITQIFRKTLPKRPNDAPALPQGQYNGTLYFIEDVNGFLLWETSAWRESPWSDIVNLNGIYQGLHNFMFQLACTGENMTKRFKIIALPNTPALPVEIYERAHNELEAIPSILAKEAGSPVAWNPNGAQPQPQAQPNPGGNIQFQPVFSSSPATTVAAPIVAVSPVPVPAVSVPTVGIPTAATAPALPATPAPTVAPAAPTVTFAAPTVVPPEVTQAPVAETQETVVASAPIPSAPAEDENKRPMKKMF